MTLASEFFAKEKAETLNQIQNEMDSASEELGVGPIGYAGNYLCEVATFAFRDKRRNNILRPFPELFVSQKGSLNLNISLRVVDGTQLVPKGSTIYKNITLSPGSVNGVTPNNETISNVMKFTRPFLSVLTGLSKIELTKPGWIDDVLLPVFAEEDKKIVLKKDHKMKQKVMVLVDYQPGQDGKTRLTVKRISKAQPTDKSESIPNKKDVQSSYAHLVEAEPGEVPASIPDIEDFNSAIS